MDFIVHRFKQDENKTLGRFELVDDKGDVILRGYTLEPKGEDCIAPYQNKRIPEGNYDTAYFASPKFNENLLMVHNENVAKKRAILIHVGNTYKDTQGCILIGSDIKEGALIKSRATLDDFKKHVYKQVVKVRIYNEFV